MSAPGPAMIASLWRLGELPDWLRPERLKPAIERDVPEFASGALALRDVRPRRIHLKHGFHGGTFKLVVDGPGKARRTVNLLGRWNPGGNGTTPSGATRFAEPGWRAALPGLGLVLEAHAEAMLPAEAALQDPARARVLLEQAIRDGSPRHADLRILRCRPRVARNNPGSRVTVVYDLDYARADRGHGWPPVVVAKTHRGDKGRRAFDSMTTLWGLPLRTSGVVTLAEPLAFLPDSRVLVQSGVPGDSTLGELVEHVLLEGRLDARARLDGALVRTAVALAALHGVAVRAPAHGWEQEVAEVRERIARLSHWIPGFAPALAPALAAIEARAAACPAQRAAPSHGSFRPAQVLLDGDAVAFIDFDGFCEAEPASDLALFRASLKQNVLRAAARGAGGRLAPARLQALLAELDELAAHFLAGYEREAPLARERIELWETLYLVENLLNTWEKVRPEALASSMALLEHHLRQTHLALL